MAIVETAQWSKATHLMTKEQASCSHGTQGSLCLVLNPLGVGVLTESSTVRKPLSVWNCAKVMSGM
jgi:hypothetical protein